MRNFPPVTTSTTGIAASSALHQRALRGGGQIYRSVLSGAKSLKSSCPAVLKFSDSTMKAIRRSNDQCRHQQVGVAQLEVTGKFTVQPRHGEELDAGSDRRSSTRCVSCPGRGGSHRSPDRRQADRHARFRSPGRKQAGYLDHRIARPPIKQEPNERHGDRRNKKVRHSDHTHNAASGEAPDRHGEGKRDGCCRRRRHG